MNQTYTTVQGDMWDAIAYSQLGDVSFTDQLIAENGQYREVYLFPAGLILTLPEIAPKISNCLPPWKQVAK